MPVKKNQKNKLGHIQNKSNLPCCHKLKKKVDYLKGNHQMTTIYLVLKNGRKSQTKN